MTYVLSVAAWVLFGTLISTGAVPGENEDAVSPLEKLFRVTDLVVIGTIGEARVDRTDFPDDTKSSHESKIRISSMEKYEAGIDVREVLWGPGCLGECLSVTWFIADSTHELPLGDLGPFVGREVILFLTRQMHGGVTVNGPSGVVELQDRARVEELLGRLPVHFECRNAYTSKGPVRVTLELTNSTDKPIVLPGMKVEEDGVILDSRLKLRVQDNPKHGPWLQPFPGAVSFDSLPGIELAPGETESFDLDLDKLFPIKEKGFHAVILEIEGFPPQNPGLFLYFP